MYYSVLHSELQCVIQMHPHSYQVEYNNIHGGKLSIENLRLYLEMSRGKQAHLSILDLLIDQ